MKIYDKVITHMQKDTCEICGGVTLNGMVRIKRTDIGFDSFVPLCSIDCIKEYKKQIRERGFVVK